MKPTFPKYLLVLLVILLICRTYAQTQQDTMYAFRAVTPVVIDGKADDACWADAQWHPISNVWIPYNEQMKEGDFSGRFKLSWDSLYLYILVEVVDDSLSDDHANPFDNYWNDDCVEIFIDEDRSKGYHQTNYNAFAYHISITYDAIDGGTGSAINLKNNLSVVMDTIGPKTYLWEIALKNYDKTFNPNNAEASRVYLHHHKLMGFSLAYCDNDETNMRENFIGSTYMDQAVANHNYITADYFGTLLLVDQDYQSGTAVINKAGKKKVLIYPNPVTDLLTIRFDSERYSGNRLVITDLNGRSVLQIEDIVSGQKVNVGSLPKGIYTLTIRSDKSRFNTPFIKR